MSRFFFPIVSVLAFSMAAYSVSNDLRLPEPVPTITAPETIRPSAEDTALAEAVPLIAKWEGLRLTAYKDVVGVWTVCYGETKGVQPGDIYTKAECDEMLRREVKDYRMRLHAYFTDTTRAKYLTPKRDAAFTSLTYNVGVSAAGKSTATRRLNAGQITGACEALTWWNKAGGMVVRGLVNRRSEEYGYCMEGAA